MVAVAEAMNSINDSRVSQIGLSTAATLALPVAGKGVGMRARPDARARREERGAMREARARSK
jgi:hypothetical protein